MNILDQLAGSSEGYPSDLGQFMKRNQINPASFNARQKMRLLEEIQKRYSGSMSPLERFGHASGVAMAQGDMQ